MYLAVCLICKKDFGIPYNDFRYLDIKYKRSIYHTCDDCSHMIQDEAQKVTGLNPYMIDIWDRILAGLAK
ncbi:MAG: hypothetical protein ACM3MK_11795 [Chitinophagales bacterium]